MIQIRFFIEKELYRESLPKDKAFTQIKPTIPLTRKMHLSEKFSEKLAVVVSDSEKKL